MPKATNKSDEDWWLDAVKRPMGAYYRISPESMRDMHIALAEVGALCASAFTHAGWDALLGDRATPPPTAIDELPVIAHARGPRGSEEHTSELQSLMRISYADSYLKNKKYKHVLADTHRP